MADGRDPTVMLQSAKAHISGPACDEQSLEYAAEHDKYARLIDQ
jgi:hypothetical protein